MTSFSYFFLSALRNPRTKRERRTGQRCLRRREPLSSQSKKSNFHKILLGQINIRFSVFPSGWSSCRMPSSSVDPWWTTRWLTGNRTSTRWPAGNGQSFARTVRHQGHKRIKQDSFVSLLAITKNVGLMTAKNWKIGVPFWLSQKLARCHPSLDVTRRIIELGPRQTRLFLFVHK